MRYTDVAIVGGGLAGSTAAAMLGRAGIARCLIDPASGLSAELRCEKIDGDQLDLLRKTGLADAMLRADDARRRSLGCALRLCRRPETQRSARHHLRHAGQHDARANSARRRVDPRQGDRIANSAERQKLTLSNGEEISARLVVIANGLNIGLRHMLGMERREISECHSITLGFNVEPVGRAALISGADLLAEAVERRASPTFRFFRSAKRCAPTSGLSRHDRPWLPPSGRRRADHARLMPRPAAHDGRVRGQRAGQDPAGRSLRHEHYLQPGIVLVGDAFSTSCPAAGTGTTKVFTDVERLCNVYIPHWLRPMAWAPTRSPRSTTIRRSAACEARSLAKAYHLVRYRSTTACHGGRSAGRALLVRLSVAMAFTANGLPPDHSPNPAAESGAQPQHGRLA